MKLLSVLLMALLPAGAWQQPPRDAPLELELKKIDASAADPDRKVVLAAAMADVLKVHRNHLILLRKQTGKSYSDILVSELERAGKSREEILTVARGLNSEVNRGIERAASQEDGTRGPAGLRPVAFLTTALDRNSAGTFYTLVPEIGVESRRGSLILALPYYKTRGAAGGVGDIYATGALFGRALRLDFGTSLALGFPSGDSSQGLGAGKVTFDVSATVAKKLEQVRPFMTGGFTNSVFRNVGYQRPYISDGNAGYASGGMEISPVRRVTITLTGFAVRPIGTQTVYNRMSIDQGGASPPSSGAAGHMGGGMRMPFLVPGSTTTNTAAGDLRDHGASAWTSIAVSNGVFLQFGVARSVPFELTTVRAGLGFDLARLLLRGR